MSRVEQNSGAVLKGSADTSVAGGPLDGSARQALQPQGSGAVLGYVDPPALRVDRPVVVLNTFLTGLAIGRDLGSLGIRVIGLCAAREAAGNYSRWIEFREAPDSLHQPDELIRFLLRLADELGTQALLLPTRDHDIAFLSRNWDLLTSRFVIPQLAPEAMDRVLNKDLVAAAAKQAGLRVPHGITVRSASELPAAKGLRFPCICKPIFGSQWRKPKIWEAVGRQKALRVDSFAALESFYRAFCHLDPLVGVHEWIDGGETNLQMFGSYCSSDQEVIAFFTARKRLQYPPLAGTGIVVEATLLPEVEGPSRQLLKALGFRGMSEIEFKRDDRDGQLYLIEINPRHWDQHGLGTAVGVNLSEALYRDCTRQPARKMEQSRGTAIWIAEAEFMRHLARVALGRAPLSHAKAALGGKRTYSILDFGDMGPALSLLGWRPTRRASPSVVA